VVNTIILIKISEGFLGPPAAASVGPFRRASMPGGDRRARPPGTDAGRNGPRDAERSEAHHGS
jgi:hypothetical protein